MLNGVPIVLRNKAGFGAVVAVSHFRMIGIGHVDLLGSDKTNCWLASGHDSS